MKRRNTRQRQMILEVVRNRCDHPTAEQIYQTVHEQDERVSRATVYRNLDVLAQEGQVLEIDAPDANRFDLRCDMHPHMVCSQCGQVCDAPIEYQASLDTEAEEKSGFKILGHQTIFRGLCPVCAQTQTPIES